MLIVLQLNIFTELQKLNFIFWFVIVVAPVITHEPTNQSVRFLERNVTLTCIAVGFPVPSIMWLHNGSQSMNGIITSMSLPSIGGTVSTLNIAMAMVNDSGNYICQALSPFGSQESAVAILVIQSKYIFIIFMQGFIHYFRQLLEILGNMN